MCVWGGACACVGVGVGCVRVGGGTLVRPYSVDKIPPHLLPQDSLSFHLSDRFPPQKRKLAWCHHTIDLVLGMLKNNDINNNDRKFSIFLTICI